jgi:hypothetical protein
MFEKGQSTLQSEVNNFKLKYEETTGSNKQLKN